MKSEISANTYEDARKQRILHNKKRFEDLGLLKLAKSLTDQSKPEKSQHNRVRSKPTNEFLIEPRRSTRARNQVSSYRDDVGIELPQLRKRSRFSSSWASYLARPVDEVKTASYEERTRAFKSAQKLQSNLQNEYPSFVKSMVRSHVYSCFWLGLPTTFCEEHLPKSTVDIVLEDESGSEYDAVFISKRRGLSGGWRAFALDHKLDDGDALVFQLTEPTRFKVFITRAFECGEDEDDSNAPNEEVEYDDDDDDDDDVEQTATTTKSMKKAGKSIKKNSKKEKSTSPPVLGTRRSSRKKGT